MLLILSQKAKDIMRSHFFGITGQALSEDLSRNIRAIETAIGRRLEIAPSGEMFSLQREEVDEAIDNLLKTWFPVGFRWQMLKLRFRDFLKA